MSLKIETGSMVWGEVFYQQHTSGIEPPNALTFYSGPEDRRGLGLCFDAGEFIRALMSLPHDRRTARDLKFYRTDKNIHPELPPITTNAGAIEWDPTNASSVLRVGSIPFNPDNTLEFLWWLAYTCEPWNPERESTRHTPFSFSEADHAAYLDLQRFLERTYPNPRRLNLFPPYTSPVPM